MEKSAWNMGSYFQIFQKKLHEIEKILGRMGAHRAVPLRSANGYQLQTYYLAKFLQWIPCIQWQTYLSLQLKDWNLSPSVLEYQQVT